MCFFPVDLITGSQEILKSAFQFTEEQLAGHFVTLLEKNGYITEDQKPKAKEKVLGKIQESEANKSQVVDILRKMASSELYIGKVLIKEKRPFRLSLRT
ncbi:MAG: hypothetical protein Tsb0015_07830 [Simkaniaceae bacterium]